MDLSVVVVTFNSAECLESCLEAVGSHLSAAEIVVVDNASTDSSRGIATAFTGVRLVENPRNDGFGRACNVGARAATQSYLLFLNPDVVVTRCDPAGVESLLGSESFGLVGPEPTRGGGLIGAQNEPSLLHDWFEQTLANVRPREWARRRPRLERRKGQAWLSGAMLLAKRSEFLQLGGFDPRFFLYYEDRDLSARYRRAGLPIRQTSALAGSHTGTASSRVEDLGVEQLGWGFLSWIEYVYIHRGERAARLAARAGLTTLRTMSGVLVGTTFIPVRRARRKRRQILELIEFVRSYASAPSHDDPTFCADARRVLSGVL
jgi:N-acetylglucosaminyl-diphospho-decaprenol L-rhamnosyltransferase